MRRARLLAALLPLVAASAGCGIRATDVVDIGDPATVDVPPGREQGTVLYFVSPPPDGRLMPVVRPVEMVVREPPDNTGAERGWRDPAKAMVMLIAGPDETEAAAGLRTELPRGDIVSSLSLDPAGVLVRLKVPVTELSDVARQQLICTAKSARGSDHGVQVRVIGSDGTVDRGPCSV
ncbi:hypothetical protein [Streptomyces sp. NPDC014734]|uniref:hypothetical protein n=1 Tax=Streptomyces sp. NPDC014734 TaxID=3364886 RepID=UPI003701D5CB